MSTPPPFPLEDVVRLPSGEQLRGARARVYDLLRKTQERAYRHRIGEAVGPPGWVPDFLLILPSVGGSEGKKRVRELRPRGVEIAVERFEDSNTHLYSIAGTSAGAPKPEPPRAKADSGTRVFEYWTAFAPHPVGPNPICVSPRSPTNPGRHWLAPEVGSREVDHLAELRRSWVEGRFAEFLGDRRRSEVTLWAHPATSPDDYDPFPAIARVLRQAGTKLDVEVIHRGVWMWRESA